MVNEMSTRRGVEILFLQSKFANSFRALLRERTKYIDNASTDMQKKIEYVKSNAWELYVRLSPSKIIPFFLEKKPDRSVQIHTRRAKPIATRVC